MPTLLNSDCDFTLLLRKSLIKDLLKEVRSASPGSLFSSRLRSNLQDLDATERLRIVSIEDPSDNGPPLFTACQKGNLEIVKYLVSICRADVEQKGFFECCDDKISPKMKKHHVTPLWCASAKGNLDIVKCLVKNGGADVNSRSDISLATPVMAACYNTYYDVVEFLVRVGDADVNIPNLHGSTCLMNSLQSPNLCEFLLDHGVDINAQNYEGQTALHYAIQENHSEVIQLLINMGADPTLKNLDGDDCFQASCLRSDVLTFQLLLTKYSDSIERERLAELYELMGARLILKEGEAIALAVDMWKKSIDIRYDPDKKRPNLPKKLLQNTPIYANYIDNYGNETDLELTEFITIEDLRQCLSNRTRVWTTCALILERILPACHKQIILTMIARHKECIEKVEHFRSVQVLMHAFRLLVTKNSCITHHTMYVAMLLTDLFGNLQNAAFEMDRHFIQRSLKVKDMLSTLQIFFDDFPNSMKWKKLKPEYLPHSICFSWCVVKSIYLIHLLLQATNKTADESRQLREMTEKFVHLNPRLVWSNDTLLHIACNAGQTNRHPLLETVTNFDSFEVAAYLIECGANVNAVNSALDTPLHMSLYPEDVNKDIIKILLKNGAHLDSVNNLDHTPLMIMDRIDLLQPLNIRPLEHISLQCLAAREVKTNDDNVPKHLRSFVEAHHVNVNTGKLNTDYINNDMNINEVLDLFL